MIFYKITSSFLLSDTGRELRMRPVHTWVWGYLFLCSDKPFEDDIEFKVLSEEDQNEQATEFIRQGRKRKASEEQNEETPSLKKKTLPLE